MAYPQLRASITSTATETNASSVVCTHPTGLTAGDLMILYVVMVNFGADRTITTPTDWTAQDSYASSNRRTLAVYKKIATSGDVSAGSTTVSFSGDVDKIGYAMFAVTGSAPGSEITLSEVDTVTPAGVTTATGTTAITPLVPESLVFSSFLITDLDLSATLTASSFSLTPTTTMTERVDVGVRDGASDGFSLFIATGEYSGLTEITSRSVTFSESVTGESGAIILLVNAPVNATGTNSLLEVSPTIFTNTAVEVGGTGTNTLLEVEPYIPAQSGEALQPTTWTTVTKS